MAKHLFVQWAGATKGHEAARVDGAEQSTRAPLGGHYLRTAGMRSHRVKTVVGELVHAGAVGIYAAPLLILGRLFGPRSFGDVCVLVFVVIVVGFFALLNLYIWVALINWRARQKQGHTSFRRPFTNRGGDALDLLESESAIDIGAGAGAGAAEPGDTVRVRGTATALAPRREVDDGALVDDGWFPDERPRYRVTRACDLVIEDDAQVPVVVRLSSAPVVIARPTAAAAGDVDAAAEHVRDAGGIVGTSAVGCKVTVEEGDRVELVGRVDQLIVDVGSFEVDGRIRSLTPPGELSSPYRRRPRGAGLLIRSLPDHPVIIRRCQGE